MIDTDKYEGHTEGPWVIRTEKVAGQTRMMSFFIRHYTNTESGISKLICSMQGIHEHNADAELIADAPLLLEEVKRLREQLAKANKFVYSICQHSNSMLMDYEDYMKGDE